MHVHGCSKNSLLRLHAAAGQAPITWADLIVIAAKVTTVLEWAGIKEKRNPSAGGGVSIAQLFGAEWQIQLGRQDATQPDPEVSIPTLDSSVDEIRVGSLPAQNVDLMPEPTLPACPAQKVDFMPEPAAFT